MSKAPVRPVTPQVSGAATIVVGVAPDVRVLPTEAFAQRLEAEMSKLLMRHGGAWLCRAGDEGQACRRLFRRAGASASVRTMLPKRAEMGREDGHRRALLIDFKVGESPTNVMPGARHVVLDAARDVAMGLTGDRIPFQVSFGGVDDWARQIDDRIFGPASGLDLLGDARVVTLSSAPDAPRSMARYMMQVARRRDSPVSPTLMMLRGGPTARGLLGVTSDGTLGVSYTETRGGPSLERLARVALQSPRDDRPRLTGRLLARVLYITGQVEPGKRSRRVDPTRLKAALACPKAAYTKLHRCLDLHGATQVLLPEGLVEACKPLLSGCVTPP